jgi:hypothetical protein
LFNVGLLVKVLVGVVQSEFRVGRSQFFVDRRSGKCFVELAWSTTTSVFIVGLLVQVLVGVAQSEFHAGLSQFFC